MNGQLRIESAVHFRRSGRGERVLRGGEAPPEPPPGRVPRISRLMALAIWFDELIAKGEVKNFAELARLGQVSRTRVTHIMNLLLLAPEIQEELLFLPRIESGSELVLLRDLKGVTRMPSWKDQQRIWTGKQKSSRRCAG